MAPAVALLLPAAMLVGCSALQAFTPGAVTNVIEGMQGSDRVAAEACAEVATDLPMVATRSGSPTLVASWDVTGEQLATYLAARAGQEVQWRWSDNPKASVEACIFDGDFETMTPGPPGNDRTAARVLIVIAGGTAQLWSVAKTKDALPLEGFGETPK